MRGSLRKYRPLVRRQTPHPSRRRCAAIADAKHRRPFSKYGGRWAAYATFSHKKGREVVLRSLAVIACDKREAFAQGSEATKQSILSLCGAMDCFASLAMTASRMVSFASAFALRATAGQVAHASRIFLRLGGEMRRRHRHWKLLVLLRQIHRPIARHRVHAQDGGFVDDGAVGNGARFGVRDVMPKWTFRAGHSL